MQQEWLDLVNSIEPNYTKMKLYDFYAQKCLHEGKNLSPAYQLSSKATNWGQERISSLRSDREMTFLSVTNTQLKIDRQLKYSRFLMTKSELLQRLERNKEAFEICNKAIKFSDLMDVDSNERIVKFLMDIGKGKEARDIIRVALTKGKATSDMEKFLFEGEGTNKQRDTLISDYLIEKKKYLAAFQTSTPAFDFEALNLVGDSISLKDFKNKVVILDFWATWCAPCIASFPAFQKVIDKYKEDKDVIFLFINLDSNGNDRRLEISDFLIERKYNFEVLLDSKGTIAQSYSVTSLPTKIVVNKKGRINFRNSGSKKDEQEMIDELSIMIEIAKSSK